MQGYPNVNPTVDRRLLPGGSARFGGQAKEMIPMKPPAITKATPIVTNPRGSRMTAPSPMKVIPQAAMGSGIVQGATP
jgi:hypothetical protein